MRKITPLVASMAVIVVASLFAGVAGTMAYFSETETVTTTFAAGTVNVRLSLDGTSWYDGLTVSTPSGWAPGDDFSLVVWIKNTGTSGVKMLKVGGSNPSGSSALANKIEITTLDATEYGPDDYMGVPISYWQGVFDSGAPLTLKEFVDSPYSACFWEGSHPPATDYLDPGGGDIKKVKIEFHFMDDAGNSYQGLTYTFDLQITGTDDTSVLGIGG